MRYQTKITIVLILICIGCSASKPLNEVYTHPENYTVQMDQNYRYRVLFPDGDDVGIRVESYQEARVIVRMACETAIEAMIHNRMVVIQRELDETAVWKNVK